MTDDLIQKIRMLKGSNKTSVLKTLMPEIDAKVREGVKHDEVLTALYNSGININIHTFRSAFYRYRKEQREALNAPAPVKEDDRPAAETMAAAASVDVAEDAFEQAMDPQSRDKTADHYVTKRRPIIRSK